MYVHRLEEGYMIKHDPKLNTHHPICNVVNLNKSTSLYLSHQSYHFQQKKKSFMLEI